MISDDERREVAARLRELEVHCWYDGMDEINSLETAIGCSIGQDWQDQNWWNRLADLIEPEPEMTTTRNGKFKTKTGGIASPTLSTDRLRSESITVLIGDAHIAGHSCAKTR